MIRGRPYTRRYVTVSHFVQHEVRHRSTLFLCVVLPLFLIVGPILAVLPLIGIPSGGARSVAALCTFFLVFSTYVCIEGFLRARMSVSAGYFSVAEVRSAAALLRIFFCAIVVLGFFSTVLFLVYGDESGVPTSAITYILMVLLLAGPVGTGLFMLRGLLWRSNEFLHNSEFELALHWEKRQIAEHVIVGVLGWLLCSIVLVITMFVAL